MREFSWVVGGPRRPATAARPPAVRVGRAAAWLKGRPPVAVRVSRMAAVLAAAVLLSAAPAFAETREVDGEALVFSHFVDVPVMITADPGLHHQVRIETNGDSGCLSVTGAGAVAINTSGCGELSGMLHIAIAQDMPLTVMQNGTGDITIGDMTAPVVLNATASGDIRGGNTGPLVMTLRGSSDATFSEISGPLKLDMAGSGDVRVRALNGPLILQHRGSGDVAIGHVEAPAVDVDSAGSGDMLLGAGNVQTLRVKLAGDGDFAFAGVTRDADLRAVGGGDIKLGKVTGTISRSAMGGSDIIVGGPAVVDATIGKIAEAIGEDRSGGHTIVVTGGSGVRHVLEVVVFAVIVFIIWRVARRGGFQRPSATMPGQAAPLHPGVAAVNETLRRVDARLGRVEGYVTSREFDLQQKFKKL